MIVGQVKLMSNDVYVCVNTQGTLEKINPPSQFRILLWYFRNFVKPFRSVNETKEFLRIK